MIFQTNEFLTDATFTGSQGPFWWIVKSCPFLHLQAAVVQRFVFSCSVKRIPDGTKTGQNHGKIKQRTLLTVKPLSGCITLSLAKVRNCPVKNERFYLFLSSTIIFPDTCTMRDNTNAFYAQVYPFQDMELLNDVSTRLDNAPLDYPNGKADICTLHCPDQSLHIKIEYKQIGSKSIMFLPERMPFLHLDKSPTSVDFQRFN